MTVMTNIVTCHYWGS